MTIRPLLAAAALAVAGARAAAGAPGRIGNVVLISIDSLRADRVGAYGNPLPVSPTIDRLAAEGVRFEQALSPTSWTLPAHATLLSGQWQRVHQVITTGDQLGPTTESLAEAFARAGWETVGFYSGPFLHPAYGFGRGFERYESCLSDATARLTGEASWNSSHGDRTNPCIGDAFTRWVAQRSGRPFFAFVHMWDVHYDYIPPEPYASMFDPGYKGPFDGRDIAGKGFPLDIAPRDLVHLLALYDGELRFTDATIARLLAALDRARALDRTLVVITSDHGEEFLDHGGKGHYMTLWDEVLRVPLIFWARSVLAPRTVPEPVSLADVAPTVLDLAGLPALPLANGRSLVRALRGDPDTPAPVYSTLYNTRVPRLRLAAVRTGTTKLLYDAEKGSWVRYDLSADPREKAPLPAADDAPRAGLALWVAEDEKALAARPAAPARATPAGLPATTAERLRALGYVQ